jgi:hypothetical protein
VKVVTTQFRGGKPISKFDDILWIRFHNTNIAEKTTRVNCIALFRNSCQAIYHRARPGKARPRSFLAATQRSFYPCPTTANSGLSSFLRSLRFFCGNSPLRWGRDGRGGNGRSFHRRTGHLGGIPELRVDNDVIKPDMFISNRTLEYIH